MIFSFDPIINNQSKILILGSMPGEESLKRKEYYANKRNHFWPIIYKLFETPMDTNYEHKVQFLLDHNIAVWDVLASCTRKGSLDSEIKNEIANDFHRLFLQYPNIKYILFNGNKAYEAFQKNIGFDTFTGMTFLKLPSTSPANTIGIEAKLKDWMIVKNLLCGDNC